NDDAFDNVQQNYFETFQVPAGAGINYRVRISTEAAVPDIDLFVGRDTNGNGLPDESEEVCRSTTPDSNEVCAFTVQGTSGNQQYWLMAQNWSGPGTNVRSSRAVVPSGAGDGETLVATGPGHTDV